jgi:PAS domain S-box-containing protein
MGKRMAKQRKETQTRRRRESSVPDFEELFHLFIENVRDYAIFILDPSGRALTWNAGVSRMLGYSEEEFVGLEFAQLFRTTERNGAQQEMQKAASTGRSDDERWHVRKDGTELWVTGVLTALRDSAGHLRGFAKVMRDTTAQRQAALEREDLLRKELVARTQAEQANRMKDEFLAVVSHELRTPLNAILGWATLLGSKQLDKERAGRAVETIERNAKAQAQLVADLLDVSRIVTGKLQLDVSPVSIQQVLDAAIESVHHAAAAKTIEVSTRGTGEPAVVEGDPQRLQQVILNLLSNAIKFTPAGGSIDVTLESREHEVEIRVRDTGQGIAPTELPMVFNRFHQVPTQRGAASGLGLGLTIARHIIEAHGGTIEAKSDGEGLGAEFIVRLPVETTMPIDVPSPPRGVPSGIDCPDIEGRSVLIVEDHPDSQDFMAFVLGQCGMRVLTAKSVDEALQVLQRESVDAIVSDIALPGGADGIDLIRVVRGMPEPLSGVPAVAVSAHANNDDRTRALAAGYQLHVAKPVQPAELLASVSGLINSRDSRS